MFTGIIEEIGAVESIQVGGTSARHRMRPRFHQQISRITAGRENAVAFASNAARNRRKDNA